jgi:DNA-binding beta-propeller fold protein YncE
MGMSALQTALTCATAIALTRMSQAAPSGAPSVPAYQFIRQIAVPGDSGWDYLSIDSKARRLYVTHADHVDVIDIDHSAIVGTIDNTRGVHGFAIAPELNRGFASDGDTAQVSIVDLTTRATIGRVATGTGPDAIVYAPRHKEGYAFNGAGHSATVFDAQSGKVVATVLLPGKPEFAVVDAQAARVYVDIEDKNLVLAIDTNSHKITALWQITPGENPSGLAIDPAHQRLFVGCRNQRMLMVDTVSGRVVTSTPIGAHVDANAFDPTTLLAFSSNGDGTVTIARESTPEELKPIQTLATQAGARTMALDPVTHHIYLVTADFALPAPTSGSSGGSQRPTIVPGTFRVLVYGPGTPH